MTTLKIERLGGIGGFGLPGSRVRSEGHVKLADLDHDTRRAVDALFAAPAAPSTGHADGFTYRITRGGEGGEEMVEVPESTVPPALAQAVRDELT
jgi:hypothetical protein